MLGFQGGLSFHSLGIFRFAGLPLGPQGGRLCGGLGSLGGVVFSSLPSFPSRLGGLSLGDTGIASGADRTPSCSALDGGRIVGQGLCLSSALQLKLFRSGRCSQAIGKVGVF